MYALNLPHSPEKLPFWDRADPFMVGAGQAASALETSAKLTPRGLRQHRATQRRYSNQASDDQGALGGSAGSIGTPSTGGDVKRVVGMAASLVMGIGVLQRLSDEAANPR